MIKKLQGLTSNFLWILLFITTLGHLDVLRAQDTDVYEANSKALYDSLVFQGCSCHKATEVELTRQIDMSATDGATKLEADLDQVYTACKADVLSALNKVKTERAADLNNFVGTGFFDQLRELALNEIRTNENILKLTNSNLNTNSTCNSALNQNYTQLASQIEEDPNSTLNECFNKPTLEERRECLYTYRTNHLIDSYTYVTFPNPTQQDQRDLNEEVTEGFVISDFVKEELENQRQIINGLISKFCKCDYVKTTAQQIECAKLIRDIAPSAENHAALSANEKLEAYMGTLICREGDSIADAQLSDDYLQSCLKGQDKANCLSRLNQRLKQLYCFENERNCVQDLKNIVLDYNHRKVVEPCRDGERVEGFDRVQCEEIAAAQFLLNANSANFIKYLCPVDWDDCEESTTKTGEEQDQYCRNKKANSECKAIVVNQMLAQGEAAYSNYSFQGVLKGLTKDKINNSDDGKGCDTKESEVWLPSSSASKFRTDKSNDACLLQKFVIENNMNHIDQEIITMCALDIKEKSVGDIASLDEAAKQELLARPLDAQQVASAVTCYYAKNINIDDQALMSELETKYCRPELYSSKMCTPAKWTSDQNACRKECMNRLLSRSFAAVDPECMTAHPEDPVARKICSIRSKLTSLATNNFPVTSCFNEEAFPNRAQRQECMDKAKSLEERMQECMQSPTPLVCINEMIDSGELANYHDQSCSQEDQLQGKCFSILNEYVNSMLAWQQPDLLEVASVSTCVNEGYANTPKGQLECKMMKLSQYGYNNRNAYIDRNFYCQQGEEVNASSQCNAYNVPYVPASPTDGLALLDDVGAQPAPAPAPAGNPSQTNGNGAAALTTLAATTGATNANLGGSGGEITATIDGREISANRSSLLSGARGDGFFGFIKDFRYLKFMGKNHPPVCRALGRAAFVRVLGTVGGVLTAYVVHKNVMKKYKEKQEEQQNQSDDPNNTSLKNEGNVQITAMDHIKQGYKGALAGLGVKMAFNLVARGVANTALTTEQSRVASGQPPTVCRAEGENPNDTINNATNNEPEENVEARIIIPQKKYEKYFNQQIEQSESVAEVKLHFEEYSSVVFNQRHSSLSEKEYNDKEFQLMLEDVVTMNDPETLDYIKFGFKNMISTTTNLIIPKAHAEMNMMQIIPMITLLAPLLNRSSSDDNDDNTSSNGAAPSRNTAAAQAVNGPTQGDATTIGTELVQRSVENDTTDRQMAVDRQAEIDAINTAIQNFENNSNNGANN